MLLPTLEASPTATVGRVRIKEDTPVFFFLVETACVGALTCSATAVGGGGGVTGFGAGAVFIEGIHMVVFRYLGLNKIVLLDRGGVDAEG